MRTLKTNHRERGQAAVEFLLTVVFLVLLVAALLELILFVHTYNVVADSAKEGLRYAIVHGSSSSNQSGPACPCPDLDGPPAPVSAVPGYGSGFGVIRTYAQYSFHNVSSTAMNIAVDYNPGGNNGSVSCNDPTCLVRITVSYPYQPFFGLGWPTVTVYSAAEGHIVF